MLIDSHEREKNEEDKVNNQSLKTAKCTDCNEELDVQNIETPTIKKYKNKIS